MLITLWSTKGGAGCSVVAALLALHHARRGGPVTLVDLGHDQSAILGLPPAPGPGLADLARLGSGVDPQAVDDIAVDVAPGVRLLHGGDGPYPSSAHTVELVRGHGGTVIVDAGAVVGWHHPWAPGFAAAADRSVLVTRPCYLALRHGADPPVRPSEVVVVREPGRAFGNDDIAAAVGAPVVLELAVDPSVARAVDSGLLTSRVARGIIREMAVVA